MKVFFDNCTKPVFASALNGFVQHEGHSAFHIKDVPGLKNGRHSTDIEWISFLRDSSEVWIFVTGDGKVLKNSAERAALKSAGLHGFVLAPAYQKTPSNQVVASIIWKWPEIVQITQLLSAPSMHQLPIGRNTKLKQLSV